MARSSERNFCHASDGDLSASAGLLSENPANRFRVSEQRVACKFQAFDPPPGSVFIAGAAGVRNEHGNVTEISAVARCRFYSNLGCYADNDKRVDAAISQTKVQPRRFDG
jgi:hypothetical protein